MEIAGTVHRISGRGVRVLEYGKISRKRYLNFTDHSRNWNNTGNGEYVIEGNILTMTTKNSIYEFEILSAGEGTYAA